MLGPTTSMQMATDDAQVHVEVAKGPGRNLVVVTPVGADWMVRALPRELTDLFTVRIIELPGTGRSPSAIAATAAQQVKAIATIASATNQPCFLFGHSMNGLLALAAAASGTPQGVVSVCAPPTLPFDAAPALDYWDRNAEPERKREAEHLEAALEAASSDDERLGLRQALDNLRGWYDWSFDSSALDDLAIRSPGWVQSVIASGNEFDWSEAARAVTCPTLLAFGAFDFGVPPTLWDESALPRRAMVRVFEQSGHTPFVEEPEEFLSVVEQWLGDPSVE